MLSDRFREILQALLKLRDLDAGLQELAYKALHTSYMLTEEEEAQLILAHHVHGLHPNPDDD